VSGSYGLHLTAPLPTLAVCSGLTFPSSKPFHVLLARCGHLFHSPGHLATHIRLLQHAYTVCRCYSLCLYVPFTTVPGPCALRCRGKRSLVVLVLFTHRTHCLHTTSPYLLSLQLTRRLVNVLQPRGSRTTRRSDAGTTSLLPATLWRCGCPV